MVTDAPTDPDLWVYCSCPSDIECQSTDAVASATSPPPTPQPCDFTYSIERTPGVFDTFHSPFPLGNRDAIRVTASCAFDAWTTDTLVAPPAC